MQHSKYTEKLIDDHLDETKKLRSKIESLEEQNRQFQKKFEDMS
jgi:hypothetical protein